jgi:hypothetical protein
VIDFVSIAKPDVISLRTGDLNVRDLQRLNHRDATVDAPAIEFEAAVGNSVRVMGQRGVAAAHIQASIELLNEKPRQFEKLITDVVSFDDAESLISSVVDWSLGLGSGDRPMRAVIELNSDSLAES